MKSKKNSSRFNALKVAIEYLRRTRDIGTFLAFLFLWKRRKLMPVPAKEEKFKAFIYPH